MYSLPIATPQRTMAQRLDAIAARQAERQVPNHGVIIPPTTCRAVKVSYGTPAPKREIAGIAGLPRATNVRVGQYCATID